MYVLEEKIYFYLLAIIPLVVLLFLFLQLWKKRTQKKFADTSLLKRLSPDTSTFKPLLKLITLLLAFTCMAFALVNPKIGTKLETVKREGVDIVFAVDVSKSMLAEDITPNRLEKAKRLISEVIDQLAGDRIGIIAYAGEAFPQLPITTDYAAAKMFLQGMNTDMLSSQGTAIGEAINMAQGYFNDEEQTNKILVIVSDGEDHEKSIDRAIDEINQKGIRIVTIGVGTPKGGPIPIKRNGITETYKKDRQGEVVITKLDEDTLKEIAQESNGEYIDGGNTSDVVSFMKDYLGQMDKKEYETKQFADYKSQFQWFLGAAILFLILDLLFLERKTAWVRKLNLFNEKNEK
ncbi:VWA domain-containing protein [Sinomicrobium sp. M5D2P9]